MGEIFILDFLLIFQIDWELVAKGKSCTTARVEVGYFLEVSECADQCRDAASMFISGRVNSGKCGDDLKCKCMCLPDAGGEGVCAMQDSVGFNLYRFKTGHCSLCSINCFPQSGQSYSIILIE